MRACIRGANLILITAPIESYRGLRPDDFNGDGRHRTVLDFWRILDPSFERSPLIAYHAIGRGAPDDATAAAVRELWAEPQDSLRAT
jgi:hypothetical protein